MFGIQRLTLIRVTAVGVLLALSLVASHSEAEPTAQDSRLQGLLAERRTFVGRVSIRARSAARTFAHGRYGLARARAARAAERRTARAAERAAEQAAAQQAAERAARDAPPREYGPFVHRINRDGLESIVQGGRLIASRAADIAGGGIAVRAHTHEPLEHFSTGEAIEFTTTRPPSIVHPRNGHASWSFLGDQTQSLEIRVRRVMRHGTISNLHP